MDKANSMISMICILMYLKKRVQFVDFHLPIYQLHRVQESMAQSECKCTVMLVSSTDLISSEVAFDAWYLLCSGGICLGFI